MGMLDRIFGPPTPEKFAYLVMRELKRAGDTRQAHYDKASFQLSFVDEDGEEAGLANLRNLYSEYCAVPRQARRNQLHHVIRAMLSYLKEMPEEFHDARHDLRPMVRTRSYFEFIRLRQEIEEQQPPEIPYHELGDHLAVSLVYDLPESMRTIPQEDLDAWGVSYYEAMEAATFNLEESGFAFASLGESVYASMTGDNYDASRLLLNDFIRGLSVEGAPVALVPNRDTLLITGSEDESGLETVAALAEQALEQPRPMNGMALILEGEEWVSWMPNASHPQFEAFKLLELKSLGGEYADQKELLDELHEMQAVEIYVASYSAVQPENSLPLSYCVWSEGVEAFLPETDHVIFVHEDHGVIADGAWEHVRLIVGDLLIPTDFYPARFYVRQFPSSAQLDAIGKSDLFSE